eukprot:3575704-Pleurochrysis_carterae.AAC.3
MIFYPVLCIITGAFARPLAYKMTLQGILRSLQLLRQAEHHIFVCTYTRLYCLRGLSLACNKPPEVQRKKLFKKVFCKRLWYAIRLTWLCILWVKAG